MKDKIKSFLIDNKQILLILLVCTILVLPTVLPAKSLSEEEKEEPKTVSPYCGQSDRHDLNVNVIGVDTTENTKVDELRVNISAYVHWDHLERFDENESNLRLVVEIDGSVEELHPDSDSVSIKYPAYRTQSVRIDLAETDIGEVSFEDGTVAVKSTECLGDEHIQNFTGPNISEGGGSYLLN